MKNWSRFLNSPLGKVLLEALRWAVLGAIATFIDRALLLLPEVQQTPDVMTMTVVLRFIDAIMHKSGIAKFGIVRF